MLNDLQDHTTSKLAGLGYKQRSSDLVFLNIFPHRPLRGVCVCVFYNSIFFPSQLIPFLLCIFFLFISYYEEFWDVVQSFPFN